MTRTLCVVVASAALMAIAPRVGKGLYDRPGRFLPSGSDIQQFFRQYDDRLLSGPETEVVYAPSNGLGDYVVG
jgi:hypothetical protein